MADSTQDADQPDRQATVTGPTVPTELVPPDIENLAASHGLGEFIDVRHGVSPSRALARGLSTAAVGLAAMVLLHGPVTHADVFSFTYSVLHAVYLAFLLMVAGGIGYSVRGLAGGTCAIYLYTGGLIRTHRSDRRAVTWEDAARLRSVVRRRGDGANVGDVIGYRLEARDGGAFTIPLVLKGRRDGRDPFIDRIVTALREHNRPIA